jgi:predicted ATPase
LFSTGTLRILALLAVLRHPQPPPLIVIEEIENGLDPRTIHLIVDEIRNVVESGLSQVILTTHSPYLLDLLPLSQIVLVERDPKGQPIFTRPADQKSLDTWAEQFTPGKLYTMGRLSQEGTP